MPASPAQIAAARANGLKSKGPVTAEGKAISRRNALKHGMAGEGVVLPTEDAAESERRTTRMLAEMRPASEMGRYLVKRMARLTVRVERCDRHELVAIAHRAEHAEAAFDEARIATVDQALADLVNEPATYARKLRSMPEGIDRIIAVLLDLREELDQNRGYRWEWVDGERFANLTGLRYMEFPIPRIRALSEAVVGKFQFLLPTDGEGLEGSQRRSWARDQLVSLIDDEIADLLAHRETLDPEAIQRDRASAAERSTFDPSPEATLARRYEAAAEREVYRALNELRRVEASAALMGPVATPELAEETNETPPGSFGAEDVAAPEVPQAVEADKAVETVTPTPRPVAPVESAPWMTHYPALVRGNQGAPQVGGLGRGPA